MEDDVFSNTIKELVKEAAKDGIITPDEQEIINQVTVDGESFSMKLQMALEDGVITDEEVKELEDLKHLILERAETIAGLDGKHTEDEKNLIQKLSTFLTRYYT